MPEGKVKLFIKRRLEEYNHENPDNKKNYMEVVKEAGATFPTLKSYEAEAPKQIVLLVKLAKVLNCTVDELLKFESNGE